MNRDGGVRRGVRSGERISMALGAALYAEIHASVFFLILLYRVYHLECSFEAVSYCGLPLLSPLSDLSLSFSPSCENLLDLI